MKEKKKQRRGKREKRRKEKERQRKKRDQGKRQVISVFAEVRHSELGQSGAEAVEEETEQISQSNEEDILKRDGLNGIQH